MPLQKSHFYEADALINLSLRPAQKTTSASLRRLVVTSLAKEVRLLLHILPQFKIRGQPELSVAPLVHNITLHASTDIRHMIILQIYRVRNTNVQHCLEFPYHNAILW